MLELKAQSREIMGKKTKRLREDNIVPGVIYGHGIESLPIQVSASDFKKVLEEAGESTLVDLKIEGQSEKKVLIHDLQYHPLTGNIEHIDFYQIKEGEKIVVEVELEFVGESPAVKEEGGILIHELDKIEIECLLRDLIRNIEVDLSQLENINDVIRVQDLNLPSTIKSLSEPEASVVAVKAPQEEKEEEEDLAAEEEAGVAEVGVVGEEDKKETEGDQKTSESEEGQNKGK
ncbi:50S ribosomal protein L25 [Patescibacteria group bacterium]|nr:50S ribosomal protein L25 [Patescibacteria group bacterium]